MAMVVWTICRFSPSVSGRRQCWLWRLTALKFVVVFCLPLSVNGPAFLQSGLFRSEPAFYVAGHPSARYLQDKPTTVTSPLGLRFPFSCW